MNSARRSAKVHLTYDGHGDFWKFYVDNQADIDRIIYFNVEKFFPILEYDDARQEILLKLHRNDFLKSFNPKLSSINTYLTNKIRGYILHLYYGVKGDHWHPYSTDQEYQENQYHQILHPALNFVPETAPRLNEKELSNDFLKDFENRDFIRVVWNKLDTETQKVFRLLLNGYPKRTIGQIFGTSASWIGCVVKRIKHVMEITSRR